MYKAEISGKDKATPEAIDSHKRAIEALLNGANNSGGLITLADGVTTTLIEDRLIGSDTVALLIPTTANAAAAMDVIYQSVTDKYEITLTHDNTADVDRTFRYILLG